MKRGYLAASEIARFGDFQASRLSADSEIRNALATVRAKTRFLSRNSSAMLRFINLLKTNVIGPNGIRLQSKVRRGDGSYDLKLNREVQEAWQIWSEDCSVSGNMTMIDVLKTIIHSWATDGESFIEIVTNPLYPDSISLNILEADMIDETVNEVNPRTGNEIRMGIEIDRGGRPLNYYVLTTHPGDSIAVYNPSQRHRIVRADRIIHVFHKDRPGQTRGDPPGKSVVNQIKMLDGYRDAEVTGRRVKAANMGFFTRETETQTTVPDELADNTDEVKDGQEETLEMEVEPGVFRELPRGVRFEEFNPAGSSSDYDQFERQLKRDISMGFNLSVFSHGMETDSISYSTARTVVIEDRDYYMMLQQFIILKVLKPIFNRWSSYYAIQDVAQIPPTKLPLIRRAIKFRPRGWQWVDPAKEVGAITEALKHYIMSYSEAAAMRGLDRDELFAEIEEDMEVAANHGIELVKLEMGKGNDGNAVDKEESDDE